MFAKNNPMRNYVLIGILSVILLSCENQAPADPATPVTMQQQVSEPVEPAEKLAAEPEEEVGKTMTPDMFVAFERFRRAMLGGSCAELAQQCVLPLEGDCGMGLLQPEHDYSANQSVSKETLVQQCNFLDENELAVLKKRVTLQSNTDVSDGQCIYKDFFHVEADGSEFSWSVGCIELLEEEVGEYSRIFVFRLVNGKFRLCRINCAG
jgi:hypothetical protein